jgi:hypothetical protein
MKKSKAEDTKEERKKESFKILQSVLNFKLGSLTFDFGLQ